MILLPPALLQIIVDAAEAAYPEECCGLLVGHGEGRGDLTVTGVEPSPNMAGGKRFEVSAQLRFDVMRALEGGPMRIVGHYHSHPDHAAAPSPRDLEMAWEPDLVWLITSVMDGRAAQTTAHIPLSDGSGFGELKLISNGETS
ncbi:MAG: M67 family metallopeptidase [Rhodospirillales bacterium]|nr:M67 family metallopeptidase [Rhodospirillales bacterium]